MGASWTPVTQQFREMLCISERVAATEPLKTLYGNCPWGRKAETASRIA